MGWALVADAIPIYPLYAILFADTGLSGAQISTLFAIWSGVGLLAEVPTGALADRFSRRAALVVAAVLQAACHLLWVALPGFPAFAVGFVLWGLGGSLVSGAFEALLYENLDAAGAAEQYPRVQGRVARGGPARPATAAAGASILFPLGGYPLVGAVSTGCCLAAAGLAVGLPEPPRGRRHPVEGSYLGTLRSGIAEAAASPRVRIGVLVVAVVSGLDVVEEYFPLLALDWGVPAGVVPLAVLGIPLAGAAGAALGAAASRLRPAVLTGLFAAAVVLLGAAVHARSPVGLAAVAVFYGVYRAVDVVVDVRLQIRIEDSSTRATVTSVAGFGTDLFAIVLYAGWALGGPGR